MNTAILRLMVGFKRFKEKYFQASDLDQSLYSRLAYLVYEVNKVNDRKQYYL